MSEHPTNRRAMALIISDRQDVTQVVSSLLNEVGFAVTSVLRGEAGVALAERRPFDLVITGSVMPGLGGMEILRRLKAISPFTPVWLLTEDRNFRLERVIEAMKAGADDFFIVGEEVAVSTLRSRLTSLRHILLQSQDDDDPRLAVPSKEADVVIATSAAMQSVLKTLARVAISDVPVLICGESGSGKEILARFVVKKSHRVEKPLVAVNCGAIPETLLEAELFGHERGAFTGAQKRRQGRIQAADKGTLFLDEIGELSPTAQVKLLRFLQEGEIQRVGADETERLDVRVVAATHQDLRALVAANRFRDDLFYRLDVVRVEVPPLRDREEDILLLAQQFILRFSQREGLDPKDLSSGARRALLDYPWPGNVRELKHRIQRAVLLADGGSISAEDLGLSSHIEDLDLRRRLDALEAELISTALGRHGGNVTQAAKDLGIHRQQLQRLLRKHGLEREAFADTRN